MQGRKLPTSLTTTAWIVPFFVGLFCGIFLHFIPGMDNIFQEAQKSLSEGRQAQKETLIWGHANKGRHSQ